MGAPGATMKRLSLFGGALAVLAAAPAWAADLPMKAPPTAAVVQTGGFYAWLDGSLQDLNLPRYNLGLVLQPTGGAVAPGMSIDTEATGWGVSGGFGVMLPTHFGTRDRFDVSGSFVHATGSQSGSSSIAGGGLGLALLNGTVPVDTGCGGACSVNGTLNTDYQSWQVSGRFATEFNMGTVILTPSVAVFGGHSRNNQTLAQIGGTAGPNPLSYSAQTALGWTDVGARAGLTATIPLTSALSFGIGGSLGGVARDVSLSGNDFEFINVGGVITLPNASGIAASASTTAFVANAEGSVTYR